MGKSISILFNDDQAEVIEKIARREEKSFADTVRGLCDESTRIKVASF